MIRGRFFDSHLRGSRSSKTEGPTCASMATRQEAACDRRVVRTKNANELQTAYAKRGSNRNSEKSRQRTRLPMGGTGHGKQKKEIHYPRSINVVSLDEQ